MNIFFPRTCPLCETLLPGKTLICQNCVKDVFVIAEPKCQKCGKALRSRDKLFCWECSKKERFFDRAVALFEHQGKIRESIYRFKYKNQRAYAAYYGDMAIRQYGELIKSWKIDAIVPVPIHKKREVKRGYNQARVFAKEIAKRSGLVMMDDIIIRKINTNPQKNLSDSGRYFNLQGAFGINTEKIKKVKNILLVDDIFTTGSTVDMCSRILKKAGAKKVYVLCISAGIDKE